MVAKFLRDPEHWRYRAEEMRTLADQMGDQGSADTMRRIAKDYEELARRADDYWRRRARIAPVLGPSTETQQ